MEFLGTPIGLIILAAFVVGLGSIALRLMVEASKYAITRLWQLLCFVVCLPFVGIAKLFSKSAEVVDEGKELVAEANAEAQAKLQASAQVSPAPAVEAPAESYTRELPDLGLDSAAFMRDPNSNWTMTRHGLTRKGNRPNNQ